MRRVAIIWLILAAVVAIVTTILNVEPASTFRDLFTLSDGSYYLMGPIGCTFLLFVSPLIFVMLIRFIVRRNQTNVPTNLMGKTGFIVQRQKELSAAFLPLDIYVNGSLEGKVEMGKEVFIEAGPGEYILQTKMGKKTHSQEVQTNLTSGQVVYLHTGTDMNKSMTSLKMGGEKLFLVKLK